MYTICTLQDTKSIDLQVGVYNRLAAGGLTKIVTFVPYYMVTNDASVSQPQSSFHPYSAPYFQHFIWLYFACSIPSSSAKKPTNQWSGWKSIRDRCVCTLNLQRVWPDKCDQSCCCSAAPSGQSAPTSIRRWWFVVPMKNRCPLRFQSSSSIPPSSSSTTRYDIILTSSWRCNNVVQYM